MKTKIYDRATGTGALILAAALTMPTLAQAQAPRRVPAKPAPATAGQPMKIALPADLAVPMGTLRVNKYVPLPLPPGVAAKAGKPIPLDQLPTFKAFKDEENKSKGGGKFDDLPLAGNTMANADTVDQWFQRMPEWGLANPKKPNSSTVLKKEESEEVEDGRKYNVTRTKYSIMETPEKIVTFSPVNGFWLGGLVQERGLSLGLGSLQEIQVPATKRAELLISSDLPMGNNFRNIKDPSATKVSSAIGELMQAGNKIKWGGARDLKIVDNSSSEEAAYALGLNARYAGAEVKAALSSSRKTSERTITAAFIERAFTVQADFEGRSRRQAFFDADFTVADARDLVKTKQVTPTNLPAFIKSVTYGRIMLFTMTSTVSESEMRAAINASYHGGFSVEVDAKMSDKLKKASYKLNVTTLGRPAKRLSIAD